MHACSSPRRIAAVSIAALCMSLAGCAQTESFGGPPPPGLAAVKCTPGLCEIKVFVDNCHAVGGIRVEPELAEVTAAVNMRWEIVTPGFVFASNGIEFVPPNPQFEPRHSPQPNEFRLHNKKAQAGDFYYAVNVQGCRRLDPWIRNR